MVLILKALLPLLMITPSQAQPLDQDSHMRFLAAYDYYNRSSLQVRTIKGWDSVEFSVCFNGGCERFPEPVSYAQIETYKEPFLKSLREYKAELENQKSGIMARLTGDVGRKRDIQAVNEIIEEIEKGDVKSWILLTKQNTQKDPAAFGTYEGAEGFYARVKSVFLKKALPPSEIRHMEQVNQRLRSPSQMKCQ